MPLVEYKTMTANTEEVLDLCNMWANTSSNYQPTTGVKHTYHPLSRDNEAKALNSRSVINADEQE